MKKEVQFYLSKAATKSDVESPIMCSIGEDDFGDEGGAHIMPREDEINEAEVPSGICKKCNAAEIAVKLCFKEAQCRNCFLSYVRHKFRATLGSSKILPKNANVLLVFDGSPESVVLLDMLYFAQEQNTFKRLHCSPKVLFVDDLFLIKQNHTEIFIKIQKMLSKYELESYYCSLASNKAPVNIKLVESSNILTLEEMIFKDEVDKIKSLTSRQDFVHKTRYNKIKSAATVLDSKFVFFPDISADLATTLLTNISLGRGSSTALDVSLLDDRIPDLKIIRPLKDLTEKEVNYYIKLNGLDYVEKCKFGEDLGSNSSLQNLTKAFVNNLQQNYPSTVSTVFRTGDKIAAKNYSLDSNGKKETEKGKCLFCQSNLDYKDSTTLLAIEFSRIVSENADSDLNNAEILEDKAKARLCGVQVPVIEGLCHGCRNIYRDYSDKEFVIS